MDSQLINQCRTLLQEEHAKIPSSLPSLERQWYVSNNVINGLTDENRVLLKEFIDYCLLEMRKRDASDIDLGGWGSGGKIWYRIQGQKKPLEAFGTFRPEETDILVQSILSRSQREALLDNKSLDISYHFRAPNGQVYRHRANAYMDLGALALNMRAINTKIRPYHSFEFHNNITRTLSLAYTKEGLILVTGITGSGKSTTLDSIVDMNNNSVEAHAIIIASPIEFVHQSKKCIIRHREVGRDTRTFKSGTIEALRQDPDIIIIGEMRDPETILAALEVADSGHKVLSTLHTSSAIESIDRIIGEMPPVEQERVKHRLGDLLRCVISQKLVPGVDGKRVLAKEVLIMIPSIKAAIQNNNTGEIYQMLNEGLKYGMITLEQDLKHLVMAGKITVDTAKSYSNNKRRMNQLLTSI